MCSPCHLHYEHSLIEFWLLPKNNIYGAIWNVSILKRKSICIHLEYSWLQATQKDFKQQPMLQAWPILSEEIFPVLLNKATWNYLSTQPHKSVFIAQQIKTLWDQILRFVLAWATAFVGQQPQVSFLTGAWAPKQSQLCCNNPKYEWGANCFVHILKCASSWWQVPFPQYNTKAAR